MIIPDVNLLLYAVIDTFPQHKVAHGWWEDTVNSSTQIGLASPAIFGFLRIGTNPRVLESPLAVETAIGHLTTWLEQPNVTRLDPGPRHLEITFDLLKQV